MNESTVISVFGSGQVNPRSEEYQLAQRAGEVLGRFGYSVATGGYAGVMEAVSSGARKSNVEVIGVICRLWQTKPNKYITRVIETDNLTERLAKLIELGKAGYVVFPGATGTLRELAEAWELMEKHIIPDRPIVCITQFWKPVITLVGKVRPEATERICFAETPEDLVKFVPNLHHKS